MCTCACVCMCGVSVCVVCVCGMCARLHVRVFVVLGCVGHTRETGSHGVQEALVSDTNLLSTRTGTERHRLCIGPSLSTDLRAPTVRHTVLLFRPNYGRPRFDTRSGRVLGTSGTVHPFFQWTERVRWSTAPGRENKGLCVGGAGIGCVGVGPRRVTSECPGAGVSVLLPSSGVGPRPPAVVEDRPSSRQGGDPREGR